jgi:class 3 adenylate cyclase/tetratricopeptide (TPR) repeat protein
MPACPNCGQENPEGFKFCGACGLPLAETEPAPEEERKVVTALFTDIVGSTASAAEMDPEDVRARLSPYYSRLRSELESFGGTVEKFIGDAVVALFGAPVAHEDDPERAVRAALAITRAVEDLNAQDEWLDIHIRTAVHTGEALVVVGAKASEGEGMAAGDVMNTAARLQGGAPVDGIAVGESTYRATADIFEYAEGKPVQAKGKTEPIPIWVVVAEKEAPERPTARAPLVGRSAELARLVAVWQEVLKRDRPRLVNLLGPPGIGKSRLLLALTEHVEEAASVHWGRCLSYGEGMTYWPLTEIIKSAAGIRYDDSTETDSAKLGHLLESLPTTNEDELRTMAAALANLVGASTTPRGSYSAESISQAELHWAIRRILPLLASERPMLLVFEDLHWAEPTLLELLRSLPHPEGEGARYLVLGTGRPELAESEPEYTQTIDGRETLLLEPLDEAEIEQLLAELLADTPVDSAHIQRLVRNAGGNPLFLEETVRMITEAKGEGDLENLPVPETVQALIGSRLDSLGAPEKRVAQQASVVGNAFWPGAVAHVGEFGGDLQPSLDTLERRDFVHESRESTVVGEREYAFKHILIRDVAYERLPKGRRAELHARFVPWLRALGSEDEFVEIEAYHLEQACLHARAVARAPIEAPVVEAARALSRAAEKAERREGAREAARFYERGIELVGDEHRQLLPELRLGRGRALARIGEVPAALAELDWVIENADALDRREVRGNALVALANIELAQGKADAVRERLEEATQIASALFDRELQVRAGYVNAALRGDFEGNLEAAIGHLQDALAAAEELGDPSLRVEGHLRAGFLLFNKGELGRAADQLARCSRLADELGSFRDQARATFMLGLVQYYSGDLEEAERLGLQTAQWLERTGDGYFQVQNLVRALAVYALARDDPALAEERVREALPLALELVGGAGWVVSEAYRYLVEALVRQGRVEDAQELVDFATRDLTDENLYARAEVALARGFVLAANGDRERSCESFEEALDLLEQQNLAIELAEARISYGRVLRDLGDERAAKEQLERARAGLAEVGAQRLVGELDNTLERMPTGPA